MMPPSMVALAALAVLTAQAAAGRFEPQGVPLPDAWIVELHNGASDAAVAAVLAAVGKHEDLSFGGHDAARGEWKGYRALAATATEGEMAAVQGMDGVKAVFPDEQFELTGAVAEGEAADVQTGDMSWGTARVTSAAPVGYGEDGRYVDGRYQHNAAWGEGVDVYVLDTGVRCTHEDLQGRCEWLPKSNITGSLGEDTHGHGTHCAGTVAGTKWGVAKQAMIYPVRVAVRYGSTSTFKKGMQFVVNHHKAKKASGVKRASVINFSWAYSTTMLNVMDAVVEQGVHLAVAAGNNNANACRGDQLTRVSDWVHVGATQYDRDQMWIFSNWGPCLDICAPGSDIWSADSKGDTLAKRLSGTSMATPQVAGALAAYLSMDGNAERTPREGKAWLLARAHKDVIYNPRYWSLPPLGGTPNLLLHIPTEPVTPTPPVPTPEPGSVALSLEADNGRTVTATHGTIVDGYDPEYPNYADLSVTVVGENCALAFRSFAVEAGESCKYDHVGVYSDGVSVAKLCGAAVPEPLQLQGGRFTVTLVSDGNTEAGGFEMDFACGGDIVTAPPTPAPTATTPAPTTATPEPTTTPEPEPQTPEPTREPTMEPVVTPQPTAHPATAAPPTPEPTTAPPTAGVHVAMKDAANDEVVTAVVGSVEDGYSPSYPSRVAKRVWVMGSGCRVTWTHMDLEAHEACRYDYVEIVDGTSSAGRYCGQALPEAVQLTSSFFQVYMRSDASTEASGFAFDFVCDGAVTSPPTTATPAAPTAAPTPAPTVRTPVPLPPTPAPTPAPVASCENAAGDRYCGGRERYCKYPSFEADCRRTCNACL